MKMPRFTVRSILFAIAVIAILIGLPINMAMKVNLFNKLENYHKQMRKELQSKYPYSSNIWNSQVYEHETDIYGNVFLVPNNNRPTASFKYYERYYDDTHKFTVDYEKTQRLIGYHYLMELKYKEAKKTLD